MVALRVHVEQLVWTEADLGLARACYEDVEVKGYLCNQSLCSDHVVIRHLLSMPDSMAAEWNAVFDRGDPARAIVFPVCDWLVEALAVLDVPLSACKV